MFSFDLGLYFIALLYSLVHSLCLKSPSALVASLVCLFLITSSKISPNKWQLLVTSLFAVSFRIQLRVVRTIRNREERDLEIAIRGALRSQKSRRSAERSPSYSSVN